MPHRGIEPASATHRSDALASELHPHTIIINIVINVNSTRTRQRQWHWRSILSVQVILNAVDNAGKITSSQAKSLRMTLDCVACGTASVGYSRPHDRRRQISQTIWKFFEVKTATELASCCVHFRLVTAMQFCLAFSW